MVLVEEEQELTRIEFGLLLEQHMYVKRLRQIEALGCKLRWDQPDLSKLMQMERVLMIPTSFFFSHPLIVILFSQWSQIMSFAGK